MGKYSSVVSMKGMMLMKMEEVNQVLNHTNISAEDREAVTDALKNAFCQWAQCNAVACAFEEILKERIGQAEYEKMAVEMVKSGLIEAKFIETYPDWEDDEWFEDDEEDE